MADRLRSNSKTILEACQLSFSGMSDKELADIFGVSEATISRWRATELWQEFQMELITAYKKQLETQAFAAIAEAS